ncbi:MAG: hypothetical protein LBQ60_06690 [Bacteroidales bacterium]|jgi:hypothetical protein|nr:hypothetical protein [Bacteroidales bacterium]
MLKFGGYLNILIAIAHLIAGLFWPEKAFEVTGAGEKMSAAAQIHPLLPYLFTILIVIVFSVFGLYGLSADNKFRKLPLLKPAVFTIAGLYLFRAIAGLIFIIIDQPEYLILEICYLLIAVFIGLLFLVGGIKKWKTKGTAQTRMS